MPKFDLLPEKLQKWTEMADIANYFDNEISSLLNQNVSKQDIEPILKMLDRIAKLESTPEACAQSLIHLQTVAQSLFVLAQTLQAPSLKKVAEVMQLKIEHFIETDARFKNYYNVKFNPSFGVLDGVNRFLSTGVRNMRASSALNAISGNAITTKIAPFLVDKDTRAEAEKFNSEFTTEALNNPNLLYSPEQWGKYQSSADLLVSFNGITSFPTTLLRYRIDTEHGQSLNVFESCIYKSDLYASPDRETLYIIALHGQGSYASKQHILRVTEARQLLQAENAINNIVVVTPDYSGSVASGGVCRSMAELAQNTVLKTVDHLIARGVDPSQIIVRGFSLGGMVATVGAAMCCRKGKEVSLINIDSFANAGKWLGNKEDLAATAVLAQWNTKADEYFDEIPEDRRYCIAKAADKMMWKTEEHQNRSLYHQLTQKHPELVNTKHLQLIDIQNFDHNDDVILMGKNNPCLAIYRETHARLLNSPLHNNDHDDSEDRPHSLTTR